MPCITPLSVRGKTSGELHVVPCGRCPDCLGRRVSGWSFRLMMEERRANSAHFVTLTYDNWSVPMRYRSKYLTLYKKDLQDYFKRLRKLLPEAKIKYYAAGEYGSNNWRPHYHIILFNADKLSIEKAWSLGGQSLGSIDIGSVTGASIGYTLKYITKPKRIPLHRNDDRDKEFSLMSKGLGVDYVTDRMIAWHVAELESRMYVTTMDGKKVSMPRFYKDKIYTEEQRKRIAFFAKIKAEIEYGDFWQDLIDKYGENAAMVKFQADKAKFDKMYKNSTKNRYL